MEFQITQGLRDALADAKVVISDAKLTVAGAASVDDMKGICRTYKSTPERLETLFDINAVSVARLFDKFAAGAAPASPVPAAPSDVAAFGSFDPNWPRYVFTDSHMEALFKDVQKAPRWALIQELSRPVY